MDLSTVAVVLRPRSPWEAVDLGFAMGRCWFLRLWSIWLCLAMPVYLLAALLLPESTWLVPTLIVWWFKPLYEPALLFWLSRAFFGAAPDRRELFCHWRKITGWRLLHNLTWRRFNPYRSFQMSVSVLEGLRGRQYRNRVLLLGRNQHAAAWLTAIGLSFEVILELSFITLVILMIPEELLWSDFWTLAFGSNDFALVVGELGALLAMSMIAPFYVCAGFSLYVNRRSNLESWDIELGFRRIASANRRTPRRPGALLATLLASVLVPTLLLGTASESAMAGAAPGRETAKTTIEQVVQHPDFGRRETQRYWKYVGDADKGDDSEAPGFLHDLFEWLIKLLAGFFKGVAAVGEVLLWIAVGVGLAFAIAWGIRHRQALAGRGRDTARERGNEFRLLNLDVSPESLPPDVAAAAAELAEQGRLREALSLLYRGMLARFIRENRPSIPGSATEGECLSLVKRERTDRESKYFDKLTREWIRLAYAHRTPDRATVRSLCLQWREANHDAGG